MAELCVNLEPEKEWFSIWESGGCYNVFYNILYNGPGAKLNTESLQAARKYFSQVFARYLSSYKITDKNSPGYNAFQEVLYKNCTLLPGVCDEALNSFCSAYTRTEIENSAVLTSFCGCFAPELASPLREYLLTPTLTYDRACDPLCSRVDTIKLATSSGEALTCGGNVCVIGDVQVNAVNSSLPFVNFTQVCSCKENCRCIFNSSNISSLLARLNLNYTLNQFCTARAICLEKQADGSNKLVECASSGINVSLSPSFYIVLAIIVILLILIGFLYVFFNRG